MSNKTMTIADISKTTKQFKDTHTLQVGGFSDNSGRLTAADVQKELRTSVATILKELKDTKDALLMAINQINSRLDKLENLVITEFTKHGWIK